LDTTFKKKIIKCTSKRATYGVSDGTLDCAGTRSIGIDPKKDPFGDLEPLRY